MSNYLDAYSWIVPVAPPKEEDVPPEVRDERERQRIFSEEAVERGRHVSPGEHPPAGGACMIGPDGQHASRSAHCPHAVARDTSRVYTAEDARTLGRPQDSLSARAGGPRIVNQGNDFGRDRGHRGR